MTEGGDPIPFSVAFTDGTNALVQVDPGRLEEFADRIADGGSFECVLYGRQYILSMRHVKFAMREDRA